MSVYYLPICYLVILIPVIMKLRYNISTKCVNIKTQYSVKLKLGKIHLGKKFEIITIKRFSWEDMLRWGVSFYPRQGYIIYNKFLYQNAQCGFLGGVIKANFCIAKYCNHQYGHQVNKHCKKSFTRGNVICPSDNKCKINHTHHTVYILSYHACFCQGRADYRWMFVSNSND